MATNPYFINARQLDSNGVWQDVVITISPATLSSGILQATDSVQNGSDIDDHETRIGDIETALAAGADVAATTITSLTTVAVVSGIVTTLE